MSAKNQRLAQLVAAGAMGERLWTAIFQIGVAACSFRGSRRPSAWYKEVSRIGEMISRLRKKGKGSLVCDEVQLRLTGGQQEDVEPSADG